MSEQLQKIIDAATALDADVRSRDVRIRDLVGDVADRDATIADLRRQLETRTPAPTPVQVRRVGMAGSVNQSLDPLWQELGVTIVRGWQDGTPPASVWSNIRTRMAARLECFLTIQPREWTTAAAVALARSIADLAPAGVIAQLCNEPDLGKYTPLGLRRTLDEIWRPWSLELRSLRSDIIIATPSLGDMNPSRLPANIEIFRAEIVRGAFDLIDAHAYGPSIAELTRVLDAYSWVSRNDLSLSECAVGWNQPVDDKQLASMLRNLAEAYKLFAARAGRVCYYRAIDVNGTGFERIAPISKDGRKTPHFAAHQLAIREALK